MRRTLAAAAVAALAIAVVVTLRVAGGGGSDSEDSGLYGSESGESNPGLPPDDAEALAAIFDPALEEIGLRLTRGGLADSPGAGADASLRDRHLALYVEPLADDPSADDYLETFLASARVFLPSVFDRWPELASMDVCQEPPQAVDDRAVPPPYTVLEATRTEAAAIDWGRADLATLVAAGDAGRIRVAFDAAIEEAIPGS